MMVLWESLGVQLQPLPPTEEFSGGGERNEEMLDRKIDLDAEEKDRDTGHRIVLQISLCML